MRVLVAGASGTVGTPLVRQLVEQGHQVLALTRSAQTARALRGPGVEPVVADALDLAALLRAVHGLTADAVIHQLTALRKPPTTAAKAAPTNRLRAQGTTHLLRVAEALGATRFVTQSFFGGYGYRDHGPEPVPEQTPFGQTTGGPFDPVMAALDSAERQVRESTEVAGIALRYGLFYTGGDLPERVRKRALPVPGGGGVLPMLHHEDAASAAVAALGAGRAGAAYNIADDEPATWRAVFTEMAAALGARPPFTVPRWLLRPLAPMAAAMMCDTTLRLDTSAARRELGWSPRYPSYRAGVTALAEPGAGRPGG